MPIDYNFPPKGHRSAQGWYDRGHLPHFEGGSIPQFLTFRLYDSVPQSVIEEWKNKLTDIQFRKSVEKFLDAGYGSCFLKDPAVATIVADNLKFHDKKKYDLISVGDYAQPCTLPCNSIRRHRGFDDSSFNEIVYGA